MRLRRFHNREIVRAGSLELGYAPSYIRAMGHVAGLQYLPIAPDLEQPDYPGDAEGEAVASEASTGAPEELRGEIDWTGKKKARAEGESAR